MKPILIDNSLCALTLNDDVDPANIYRYIEALGETGVRYVELDFRTLMKLHTLPENVGYIFRLVDPMFMSLCEVFKFNYIHITLNDIRKRVKTPIPAMLGLSASDEFTSRIYKCAVRLLDGEIAGVRLRGSYSLMSEEEAARYVSFARNEVPVPVDICPMNGRKAALDSAIKFFRAGIDCVTVTMGQAERYCSLDDLLLTLLSVYDALPREFDLAAMCKAAFYQRIVFKNVKPDLMPEMLRLTEYDSRFLKNADTGDPVRLRVAFKTREMLRKNYVTALERMAREENIPSQVYEELTEAISRYDLSIYNSRVLRNKKNSFLN